MNLCELDENDLNETKKSLIENGTIFKKNKMTQYDAKFFETVTLSNTLIKIFLFFSLGMYVAINLVGIILSIIYGKNFSLDIIGILVGLAAICIIVSAIFSNINTNKKKELFPLFIKGENFIFNFNNGVVESLKLFFTLHHDNVQKIEFIIHGIKKKQLFGSVTFTFNVLDYIVTHSLRYTNLTAIENYIKDNFPTLLNKIIIDGKGNDDFEKTKDNRKLKYSLIAFAVLAVALSLIVVPLLLKFNSIALIISGAILILTAIFIFLSSYTYTYFLVQGIIISSIFIIIGFCVPLLIIECSKTTVFDYILKDPEILMATIFGIIGLCLYTYIVTLNISKLHYILHKK